MPAPRSRACATNIRARIDALFEAVVGRGLDVEHDRAIIRDLLALAPPGIDELFALSILGDALADGRFARIIVDPAPTGHLLRLLEMPAIALDWTHRLMRLLLKYRDVVGLGDTAQELLDFAKRTRALDALLHDRAAMRRRDRLARRAGRARRDRPTWPRRSARGGIDVRDAVWNRVRHRPRLFQRASRARQFFAEERSPPPIGATALREWSRSWREISPNP